ncbi:MAG: hypothetical protein OXC05_06715 [Halieaceae bacterium]|nr:hypothetical protein [Halieaceae bacterium]
MSQEFSTAPVLRIEIRLPGWAPWFARGFMVLVLLAIWSSRLNGLQAGLLSVLALLYADKAFARVHHWKGGLCVQALTLGARAGYFEIETEANRVPVQLLPGTGLWRRLVVLRCGGLLESGEVSLLLFDSTVPAEQWRRLRRHLLAHNTHQ